MYLCIICISLIYIHILECIHIYIHSIPLKVWYILGVKSSLYIKYNCYIIVLYIKLLIYVDIVRSHSPQTTIDLPTY